jgi:hypothetical protein
MKEIVDREFVMELDKNIILKHVYSRINDYNEPINQICSFLPFVD